MGCKNWWWDTKEGERTTTPTPTLPFTPNPSPKKPNTLFFFFWTNSWYIDTYPEPRLSSFVVVVLLHLALRTDFWRKKRLLLRGLSIPGSKFNISNMVTFFLQGLFSNIFICRNPPTYVEPGKLTTTGSYEQYGAPHQVEYDHQHWCCIQTQRSGKYLNESFHYHIILYKV